MRVPFEWLREIVEIPADAGEAAHCLTMLGLEVESMDLVDGDTVFEVNVTPNRPDCLSIVGIARELSAAYGNPLNFPEHDITAETDRLDFNIDIVDTDLCHRYAGRIIKQIKIGESPDWLKKRLEKCGIRTINNIVDITNYVLLELGHPLHAFDLDLLKGKAIRVGAADSVKGKGAAVKITALDGVEHTATGDTLLIWDAERPVAIAGIMGGRDTEVRDTTANIFIESAYFKPSSIRRTSKMLGIKTESSYRFERGADIEMLKNALDRAAYLIKEIAGGMICGRIDIYPKSHPVPELNLRFKRVREILGIKLSDAKIFGYLKSLGIDAEKASGGLIVKPPSFRRDLNREIDLIEEIMRIHGYDKAPSSLPMTTIGIENAHQRSESAKYALKKRIKDSILKAGFTEAINFSFLGQQDIDLLCIEPGDERRCLLKKLNPLRIEDSYMRTTLVPSLLKNLMHNLAHDNKEISLFELSKIFINTKGRNEADMESLLPVEKENLALLYYSEKSRSLYKEQAHEFYIIKGVAEALLMDLGINDYSFERSQEPFLHPGQSADIYLGSQRTGDSTQDKEMRQRIGYVGAVSPLIIDSLGIKAHKPSLYVMEICIDPLIPYLRGAIKYSPLPKYPSIERDTAIVVDSSVNASDILHWLKLYPSDIIEDVNIFDVYQGKGIPEGKKSIAFNVRYRAFDRTLRDEEADAIHIALNEYIAGKTNGQIRQ
ncbi:MAG: phenylalanine--tRNA ligase subunit beta [Nitrospirae bacterium]|nr:phenylalanine--tRNA ligase subunit beta [Nitrospirota bacterium]